MTDPIVTVTPNPVVDVGTTVDEMLPDRKLRCSAMRLEPGGGGVNCARVIDELGGRSHSVYAAGGATGALLDELLDDDHVERTRIDVDGRTRLGVHVNDEQHDEQYRLAFPGPDVCADLADALIDAVVDALSAGTFVIASGSLPPGLPHDFHAVLAKRVRAVGAELVLDTTGPWLRPALDAGVAVVRNNQREFGELLGEELDRPRDRERALRSLVESGAARIAVMGLGADGSLAVSGDGAWMVSAPDVDVVSRVGAGDSLTGALTLALARGWDTPLATAYGVAAGAAAVTTPGTQLCTASTTDDLYERTIRVNGLT